MLSTVDLLTAMIARLRGDVYLAKIVRQENIVNHRPQASELDTLYPCIVVRVASLNQYDAKDSDGYDASYVLDIITKQHGDLEIHRIIDHIHRILHNKEFTSAEVVSALSLLLQVTSIQIQPSDGVSHSASMNVRHLFTT